MNFDNIILSPAQQALLKELVKAHRWVPVEEQREFLDGGTYVEHTGFLGPNNKEGNIEVSAGDLAVLESYGLIVYTHQYLFVVTRKALSYHDTQSGHQ